MATIHVLVPEFKRDTFSGGLLCIFEYCRGLSSRGHRVVVIPMLPSGSPRWFAGQIGSIASLRRFERARQSAQRLATALWSRGSQPWHGHLWDLTTTGLLFAPQVFSPAIQQALGTSHVRAILQGEAPADVTLATSYPTAVPASLYGSGRKFYFAQHYEPYFSVDAPEPGLAEWEARSTYSLPLKMIANSTWLQRKLQNEKSGDEVFLCPNAIDHQIFRGTPHSASFNGEVKVISYGGRSAQWKGFLEMAEAMRIARTTCIDLKLRWLVYGSALLPPNNAIAPYEPLGFLNSPELATAYRSADILLSASWYESFPLFPLEAMACGLPVITTQPGTEDFAIHEVTAQVVEPRNPASIAAGLIRLLRDDKYRTTLAAAGNKMSRGFSWEKSVAAMESILLS